MARTKIAIDTLVDKKKGPALPSSGHVVTSVLTQDGSSAYFKPVIQVAPGANPDTPKADDEDVKRDPTYPDYLARDAVATSVLGRYVLGPRIDDNALVYDKDDNICGTISYALDGFRSFLTSRESLPDDRIEQLQGNPTPEILLTSGIARIAAFTWRNQEEDLHPGNLGLVFIELSDSTVETIKKNGITMVKLGQTFYEIETDNLLMIGQKTYGVVAVNIDHDMSNYPLTSILKGPRIIHGLTIPLPKDALQLNPKHLDDCLSSLQCTYWPFNVNLANWFLRDWPKNNNFFKCYMAFNSFEALLTNPTYFQKYQIQFYEALLEQLLVYNPADIKARLVEKFGDEPLDYDNPEKLDAAKIRELEAYSPEDFNKTTSKAPYVDHKLKMIQDNYNTLYRMVVWYQGCSKDKNLIGADQPSFVSFLAAHPEAYHKIMARLKAREEFKPGSYNLEYIKRRYEQIWRDAHIPIFASISKEFEPLINSISERYKRAPIKSTPANFDDKKITTASAVVKRVKCEFPPISADENSFLAQAYRRLVDCYNRFNDAFDAYTALPLEKLGDSGNLKFKSEMVLLLLEMAIVDKKPPDQTTVDEVKRKKLIADLVSPTEEWVKSCKCLYERLENLSVEMDFKVHTDKDKDKGKTNYGIQIIHDHYDDQHIVSQCFTLMKESVDKLESAKFTEALVPVIEAYAPSALFFWSTKKREPMKDYLLWSTATNSQKLCFILSQGGVASNSLNTSIIKKLFELCATTLDNSGGYAYTPVSQAIKDKVSVYETFAAEWQKLAANDATSMDPVCGLLFDIAAKWSQSSFYAIVRSALDQYKKETQGSRVKEVEGYLSKGYANRHVLGLILSNGEESSSLNKIVLRYILNSARTTLEKNPGLGDENKGYKVFKQTTPSDEFLDLLKNHPCLKRIAKVNSVPERPKLEDKTQSLGMAHA